MTAFRPAPAQNLPVYLAADFIATDGANMGDSLSFAAELVLDDVYERAGDARMRRLSLLSPDADHFRIAEDTGHGTPGARLHLDSALTFMSPDGQINEALLLVELDDAGHALQTYLLPLTHLRSQTEYRLVGIDARAARRRFGEVACVSFTRGTAITMGSGEQRLIETLQVGDRLLTRDDGVQEIRWIGQTTLRAVGDFAPIRIRAGTLNNENDLIVSPDHRLFIYQREDALGAGRPELLVKARHLVNGEDITVQDGGFVDYFQLLFDGHQIIYAEGIAAESMLIDPRTRALLPADLSARMGRLIPGHSDQPHAGLDVDPHLLDRPDAADLLRRASRR
ncbi:Hint domain-containing protein [Sulfitobacter aestuarii]|uniref:Hint domain-containing protein n=1 Tax=Sulfitobacter aestuarii TaxID=2161676 RepID=A0ABW5TY97_9RHOB